MKHSGWQHHVVVEVFFSCLDRMTSCNWRKVECGRVEKYPGGNNCKLCKCPWMAQTEPCLKPNWTSLERPANDCNVTVCKIYVLKYQLHKVAHVNSWQCACGVRLCGPFFKSHFFVEMNIAFIKYAIFTCW